MSIIDTTTGHSPKSERRVARVLYVSIAVAVVAVLALIFIVGQDNTLNPFKSKNPQHYDPPAQNQVNPQ